MFGNLNRDTLAYFLDLLGFGFLLVACVLHSWAWDGAGIGLLLLAALIKPPAGLAGALTTAVSRAIAIGSLMLATPQAPPIGVRPLFEVEDQRYIRKLIEMRDADPDQYEFAFSGRSDAVLQDAYLRNLKPCGNPLRVRAWEDTN